MANELLLRAIYLEDTESEYLRFAPLLERALSVGHFACKVDWTKDRTSFEEALKKRPHIAFCDLDLGAGPLRFEGAQIIAQLKARYPDVIFVLLTGQRVTMDILGSCTPNPDHILNKEYLGTQEYDAYLGSFFSHNFKRYPVGNVTCQFELREHAPRGAKGRLEKPDLDSLVEQCLFGVDAGIEGTEIGNVELHVIPDGLSGSGVFLMHIWTGTRRNSVPAILKVSEIGRAREELANYNRYVKWRLPYLWRVDVLGFGICGGFGAICYSFAMAGGKEPASINKYLRIGESKAVDAVVSSILFSKNQNWYAERRDSGKDGRIYFSEKPYYNKNSRREHREQFFRTMLSDLASKAKLPIFFGENKFHFANQEYLNVHRCVFGRDWGTIVTCVCHGDMNGSNIMYTGDREEVAFIDFQNTGFHYLFKDFVSFESSVRLEFSGDDLKWDESHFLTVLEGERRLIAGEWIRSEDDGSYIGQISKVRYAANQNFLEEKFQTYVLANTVHSLWLLEKSPKWAPYKQRRLLAAILAGIQFLHH
jgi:hypothetical protein